MSSDFLITLMRVIAEGFIVTIGPGNEERPDEEIILRVMKPMGSAMVGTRRTLEPETAWDFGVELEEAAADVRRLMEIAQLGDREAIEDQLKEMINEQKEREGG